MPPDYGWAAGVKQHRPCHAYDGITTNPGAATSRSVNGSLGLLLVRARPKIAALASIPPPQLVRWPDTTAECDSAQRRVVRAARSLSSTVVADGQPQMGWNLHQLIPLLFHASDTVKITWPSHLQAGPVS